MILLINGSGRADGNGAYLADMIATEYRDIKRINLRDITYKDCNACGDCRKQNQTCTIEDDLMPFYPDFMAADAIILISPSYYGLPSGDVKKLIDRWYCMKKPKKQSRFKSGAKMLVFMTQGSRRKISIFGLFWLKMVMTNHKCIFRSMLLTDCSFDNHEGIIKNKDKIMKKLRFLKLQ